MEMAEFKIQQYGANIAALQHDLQVFEKISSKIASVNIMLKFRN